MSAGTLHPYRGEMLSLERIAMLAGKTANTVRYRMRKFGCSAEEAAHMVIPEKGKRYTWTDGRSLTLREISAITGISASVIDSRLRIGIPFIDACTKRKVSRFDYGLDMTPRLSEFDRYMLAGEINQRGAKAICREMLGIDPRKVNLRELNYWIYLFDTDDIAFEIAILRDIATCIGRLKNNGNVLIQRKYRIGMDKVKEVTYG